MPSFVAFSPSDGTILVGEDLKQCFSGNLTDTETKVRDGRGEYTFPNRFFHFQGTYSNGVRHGRGTLSFGDGGKFTGDFVNGEITGDGKRTFANGSWFEGQFVQGEPCGEGTFYSHKGWTYRGAMDTQPHGHGEQTWRNGDTYVGTFKKGKRHGFGTWSRADGYKYTGDWAEDQEHGQGSLVNSNGDSYEGAFEKGRFHGKGSLTQREQEVAYQDCTFHCGHPDPRPTHLTVDYPKTVDKKKGDVPPELTIGTTCAPDFAVKVTVRGRQHGSSNADAERINAETATAGEAASEQPEMAAADADVTCTNEAHRIIRVHVCQGWPDDAGALGDMVQQASLGVPSLPAPWLRAPAGADKSASNVSAAVGARATTGASAEPSSGEAATEELSAAESHTLEGAMEHVAVGRLLAVNGVATFSGFEFGRPAADGSASLQPGPYTLVFSSADTQSAVVSVTAVAAKK